MKVPGMKVPELKKYTSKCVICNDVFNFTARAEIFITCESCYFVELNYEEYLIDILYIMENEKR